MTLSPFPPPSLPFPPLPPSSPPSSPLPGLSLDPGRDVEVTVVDFGSPLPVSLNTKLFDAAQPATKALKKKKKRKEETAEIGEASEKCLSPLEVRMSDINPILYSARDL